MSSEKHFLFVPHALWGHIRPSLSMALTLLPLRPDLHISLIFPTTFSDLVEEELNLWSAETNVTQRLNLIKYGPPGAPLTKIDQTMKLFAAAGEMIQDQAPKLVQSPHWDIPISVVLYDVVLMPIVALTLDKVGEDLSWGKGSRPKFIFNTPVSPNSFDWYLFDMCQPNAMKVVDDEILAGKDVHETWVKNIDDNRDLVKIPDTAPMYTYEAIGNQSMEVFAGGFANIKAMLPKYSDAYVLPATPYLNSETLAQWKAKPLHLVGPCFPPESKEKLQIDDADVRGFLDGALSQYGANSVALISFGSLYFPLAPTVMPLLIEALGARGKPALMTVGNAPAEQSEALNKAIEVKGKGLIKVVKWVDQRGALAHEAVGWMLGHAGQGGIQEAIWAGIPMVMWPISVDQPFLANQLSQVFGCGIELVQIRTGVAVGRPTARGTTVEGTDEAIRAELKQAFGEMDTNRQKYLVGVERARQGFKKDLQPGGRAYDARRGVCDL